MGRPFGYIFSETSHRSNHQVWKPRISSNLGFSRSACKALMHWSDEGVLNYLKCLCGLLMVLTSENFALCSEPILILEPGSASPFDKQLVSALADFYFQFRRRTVQRRGLPHQGN